MHSYQPAHDKKVTPSGVAVEVDFLSEVVKISLHTRSASRAEPVILTATQVSQLIGLLEGALEQFGVQAMERELREGVAPDDQSDIPF